MQFVQRRHHGQGTVVVGAICLVQADHNSLVPRRGHALCGRHVLKQPAQEACPCLPGILDRLGPWLAMRHSVMCASSVAKAR